MREGECGNEREGENEGMKELEREWKNVEMWEG